MSMLEKSALATALALGLSGANAADAPRYGQPMTPADLAPWDISIAPDGVGLPPGRPAAGHPRRVLSSTPSVVARSATARRAVADQAARWSAVVRSTALTA